MLIATAGVIHAGDAAGLWKKLQQHRLIPRPQKAEKCYCLLVLCTPPLSSRSRVTSWSGSGRRNTGNNCTYKDGLSTPVRLLYTAQQEFISNQRRLGPHKTVQPQANEIRFVKYINSNTTQWGMPPVNSKSLVALYDGYFPTGCLPGCLLMDQTSTNCQLLSSPFSSPPHHCVAC